MALRLRRGTDTQRQTINFVPGELVWTSDTGKLYIGDGSQGGQSIIKYFAGPGLSYDVDTDELKLDTLTLTTDDINQGSTNLYFSNSAAQNATADLFANGTHVGISYIYDNDPLTPSISSTVSVSSEVVEDAVAPMFTNGIHSGVTFTYTDNGSGHGVINASVTVDPEDVQDAVDTLISNGTSVGIDIVYDDLNDKLDFSINNEYIYDLVGTAIGGTQSGISVTYDTLNSKVDFSVSPEFIEDTVALLISRGIQTGLAISYTDSGTSPGALSFTVDTVQIVNDTAPSLGGNLDLDSFDITGTGNIDILGDITAPGTVEAGSYSILEGSIASGNILKLKGNHTSVFCPTDGTIAEPGWLSIDAHKGTYDLPLNLSALDMASTVLFRSYFADDYQFNGAIIATLDSGAAVNAVGIPGVPATISVKVKSTNAAGSVNYDFKSDGTFVSPGAIQTGTYANMAARDLALPYATPGMIIFLTDGSGTGTPQFHGCVTGSSGTYGDPGYVAPVWATLS